MKVAQSCLFVTLWTIACQAPLPMEFSRQEYWSGLVFTPTGDLPYPEMERMSVMSPVYVYTANRKYICIYPHIYLIHSTNF